MNRFDNLNCGRPATKHTSTFQSFAASARNKDRTITAIRDISPMSPSMAIKGKCISIWHSHKLHEEHDPYSLDCVFQDSNVSCLSRWITNLLFCCFLN